MWAAQEEMLTPRDPGAAALCLGVDGPDHREWGKIPQKEVGKIYLGLPTKGKKERLLQDC